MSMQVSLSATFPGDDYKLLFNSSVQDFSVGKCKSVLYSKYAFG